MSLNENDEKEICQYIRHKISVKNVSAIYYFSHNFKLSDVSDEGLFKLSLRFIERCFSLVANTQNLLELGYNSLAKIISSSDLNIDTELEMFYLAERWLCHKHAERSKYAKHILFRIRLPLLSVHALNHVLNSQSSLVKNDECAGIIKEVIRSKEKLTSRASSRYCSQKKFNVIFSGGKHFEKSDVVRDVYSVGADKFHSMNYLCVNKLPQMKYGRKSSPTVCVKGEVYVFGGLDRHNKSVPSVEKYSPVTNTWEILSEMYDHRRGFSCCSFLDDVYVVGGTFKISCVKFNTKEKSWKEVSALNESRFDAASAVFEGKVVVCGGCDHIRLNTVEAYDHVAGTWTYMSNMIKRRKNHRAVAIKNKLFVVGGCSRDGGKTCEVFDSTCNMFLLLKPNLASVGFYFSYLSEVIALGSKLVVFSNYNKNILCYDLEFDKWSEIPFEVTYYLKGFHCAKLPQLYHANEVNII